VKKSVIQWTIAGGLAVLLAAMSVGQLTDVHLPSFLGGGFAGVAGEACDKDAKPANLDFTLKDVNGKDVHLAQFKGKVLLLDFWATWCGPCKIEIPGFIEFNEKYKNQGFVVVGVSVDDTVELLRPYINDFRGADGKRYQMNYPVLLARDNPHGDALQEAFGPIWGLPTTYLISREGMICKKHMGLAAKEQFEKEIKALL
jgi:thiol-disulfide isomerase/thioredoxin